MEYKFETNIMCGSCIATVTPHMEQNQAIEQWKVDTNHPQKILTVETNELTEAEVQEIVNRAGYKAERID